MARSNKLNKAQVELLAMLAEECGEVVQVVGKILRHGYESFHPTRGGPRNRELLFTEIRDIRAVVELLTRAGELPRDHLGVYLEQAIERKLKYSHHQRKGKKR